VVVCCESLEASVTFGMVLENLEKPEVHVGAKKGWKKATQEDKNCAVSESFESVPRRMIGFGGSAVLLY